MLPSSGQGLLQQIIQSIKQSPLLEQGLELRSVQTQLLRRSFRCTD